MNLVNENFLELQDSYLFSTIAKKVAKYTKENPDKKIIKLGIGDVTKPIVPACINAMHKAVDEIGTQEGFKGYGPEQGYEFLRKAIVENDYKPRNIQISEDEVFVSDGAKCDCGNIVDIFAKENVVAITDPVYPVYLDTNIMSGRKIVYLPVKEENGFKPELPKEKVDMIYLCFPNNPTGTILEKEELKKWIDYAKENKSIILYDAAYEAFISEDNIPHSIYEIEGAKDVAIEFKSYSKTAGFTGVRCAYVVIPKSVKGYTKEGNQIELNKLWNRRTCTKFNGVSYIVQRAAEATYSEQGKKEIEQNGDTTFYLASDSEEDKRSIVNRFGNRVFTSVHKADRNSLEGMQEALVELYLLSRTRHVLGSVHSSFSETAAQIGKISYELLRDVRPDK